MCMLKVLLFSVLRQEVGESELMIALEEPLSGIALLDHLEALYPPLGAFRSVVRLAVNQEYCPDDTLLTDGDEVALITPVSGG